MPPLLCGTLKQSACLQSKTLETPVNKGFSGKEALIFISPFSVFLGGFLVCGNIYYPPCGFDTPLHWSTKIALVNKNWTQIYKNCTQQTYNQTYITSEFDSRYCLGVRYPRE